MLDDLALLEQLVLVVLEDAVQVDLLIASVDDFVLHPIDPLPQFRLAHLCSLGPDFFGFALWSQVAFEFFEIRDLGSYFLSDSFQ